MSRIRAVTSAVAFLVLAAALCVGWFSAGPEINSGETVLETGDASTEVVPAQNVMVLPAGSIQSGLQQVLGTVTGIRVTGELRPVGQTSQAARVTELAPGREVVPQVVGQLEAVSPQVTAESAGVSAAAAPVMHARMRGAVQAAVRQAGAAAVQAREAVRSPLEPGGSVPQSADTGTMGAMGDAARRSAAHLSFNGGVFWQAAQAAAQDKSEIKKLATRQSKLGSEESQLSTEEKGLGALVSSDGVKDTALTSVVKHNRFAINDLTEKLRRQKLIDEGQYGILYRRLTAVADRLRKVENDESDSKKAILRAQATLHLGNQMLATAGPPVLQPVQGPPAPQPYYASPIQYTGPQVQYAPYQQLAYPKLPQTQQQAQQSPATSSLSASQVTADIDCAKAGVFCSKTAGLRQDESDWGRLGTASEQGAREASEEATAKHDEHQRHSRSRSATIHEALEDMDPEQLMSGYHLAGGAHPGKHLASARRSWFQQHLAELHRRSGSVIRRGGDGDLSEKRAQITKKLLKLASAPEHGRASPGGEPARLGVAARTFAAEARAAEERNGAGVVGAGTGHRREMDGHPSRGSEEQRLDALEEKHVLAHGVPDAFSREESSLREAMRQGAHWGEAESGREAASRSGNWGEGEAVQGRKREEEEEEEEERRGVRQPLDAPGQHRRREEDGEAARARARQHAAKRLWSDSMQSRAAAGFERASKAQHSSPYKAAMTGAVFEHFLRHPNPRQLSGQALARGASASAYAGTHSSEAAMVARAGVRTHSFQGHDIPSGYTGFAGGF